MTEYHQTVARITDLLHEHVIAYKTFTHEAVRTSEEAAALRPEYSLAQGAKALIVRIKKRDVPKAEEKQFVQIVVPGDAKFDTKKTKVVLAAKDIRFATEAEVGEITDGVKPGGVPPFGNLFGLAVYAEETLLQNEEIIFNAGDKRFSIAMRSADYITVVNPKVVAIV
jgi:prolyl-tRNA editing enzyme YbaK/EbsC (Cys-tRNA(Pro) deacylase)